MAEPDTGDQAEAEMRAAVRALRQSDKQLAYLAVLTRRGLKPLSRWEKPLRETEAGCLRELGLVVAPVARTVKIGKTISESIFSRTEGYVQIYRGRFEGAAVDKSPATARLEGFLFGFPPCCVDFFLKHPYGANGLDQAEPISRKSTP